MEGITMKQSSLNPVRTGFRILLQIKEEKWGHRLIQLVWISTRQLIMWLNRVYGPPPSCIHSLHPPNSWEICSKTWMIRALVCFLGSLCVLMWTLRYTMSQRRLIEFKSGSQTGRASIATPPHRQSRPHPTIQDCWARSDTHITYNILAVPNIKRELRHFSNRRKTWEIVMGNVILFFLIQVDLSHSPKRIRVLSHWVSHLKFAEIDMRTQAPPTSSATQWMIHFMSGVEQLWVTYSRPTA